MSGSTSVYRAAGPTVALSVVATSHAAVPILLSGNDQTNYLALLNTGAVVVAVRLSQTGVAATLPIDGTPGDFILPAAMTQPLIVPMPMGPSAPAQITAIGATAGPSLIYATPVVIQS
jgi:hypothetical protein